MFQVSNLTKEYDSIYIGKNTPVKKDLALDALHENLYVMTSNKVVICFYLGRRGGNKQGC